MAGMLLVKREVCIQAKRDLTERQLDQLTGEGAAWLQQELDGIMSRFFRRFGADGTVTLRVLEEE